MTADPRSLLPTAWSSADEVAWPFTRLFRDLAAIAYDPEPVGRAKLGDLGLTGHLLTGRGVEAFPMAVYAVRAGSEAILAFRGTQSRGSILQDLKVIDRQTPDGRLHAGFADGYADIHDGIVSRLRRDGAARVWLTGHSLGGALAVVGAMRLAEAGIAVAGVVTFGQPMVVRADLARVLHARLHDRYVAFVNANDPVPRLVIPFVHFGRRVLHDAGSFTRFDLAPRSYAAVPPGSASRAIGDDPLEPMDRDDLAALIGQIEAEAAGNTLDAQGRSVTRGLFNPFQEHSLAAYGELVDRFLAASRA